MEARWYSARTGGVSSEQLLHINVQWFRGGLVFKAHRLCVSLNSRLERNKDEEDKVVSSEDIYPRRRIDRSGTETTCTSRLQGGCPIVLLQVLSLAESPRFGDHRSCGQGSKWAFPGSA